MNIKNKEPNVQNITEQVKNNVVEQKTQEIFDELVALESMNKISDIISDEISNDLAAAGIMTENLELSEQQKERLSLIHI